MTRNLLNPLSIRKLLQWSTLYNLLSESRGKNERKSDLILLVCFAVDGGFVGWVFIPSWPPSWNPFPVLNNRSLGCLHRGDLVVAWLNFRLIDWLPRLTSSWPWSGAQKKPHKSKNTYVWTHESTGFAISQIVYRPLDGNKYPLL